MINFENIKWRNFLSTGNQFTQIDFTESSTTLIVGSNGAGKSTLLDALTFSLFGKPYRKINKPQLVNSTNEKDCLVEVNFTIGKVQYKVVRGIKPNIFEIHKNGKVLDQHASAVDQQKWFEQTVLKMNFKSFTQIVILGSASFIPFMQLTSSSRREVVEDLLDIKIFSSMNTLIKEKIKMSRDEVKTLDLKKDSLTDKVEMQSNFIDEIENEASKSIDNKTKTIATLESDIDSIIEQNEQLQKEFDNQEVELAKHKGASKKLKDLSSLKGKLSQKIQGIVKEHKFFSENTVCPTCNQDIKDEFRLNRIDDSQNKAQELQQGFEELQQAIKEEELRESSFKRTSEVISKLLNDINSNNTQVSGFRRQIKSLESEIQTITDRLENRNAEHEKLEQFRKSLQSTYDLLAEKKESISYYDFTYSLLKDGGVKAQIIKKYLPLINQSVNKYLQMMDFYINLQLDEEFNESVQSPIHEDFSYSSFSEGEKQRIDLALLFTWREIAKVKNSVNTNIMIFDEVFDSSLDGVGTEEFLKIIRYVIQDANIFVISHKSEIGERFENVIRFEKLKGFSSISL